MDKPNIVLVLADDLGFSDLGCYGGEIRTPTLDKLGRSGVRLSQFYNTARCSPSRASLLTGLHPHQTGIGVLTRNDEPDGYPGNLNAQCTTIAETLHAAGWQTWMSGKWHLSADTRTPNGSWPTRRGFDRFFGTLTGCGSYYNPQTLMRGETPATDALDNPNFYYTDAISNEAVTWIDKNAEAEDPDPFFLSLPYTAPHWPLHVPEADAASYDGVYDVGWDTLRSERLSRLIDEGIIPAGTPLSERDPSQPEWEDASSPDWQSKRMQVYAAQVERLDSGVGRVVDALHRAGVFDNTLIIFVSDNGASAEELPIGEMDTFVQKDDALRAPTRDGLPMRIGNDPAIVPGAADTYASYGVPWANLSNTPLRRYKRWVHEGGISAPFLASWPDGGLDGGRVVHAPFQLVDVVPTLLEAVGIQLHDTDVPPLEGRSMLPAWRGRPVDAAPLYWEHIGNAAIRRDQWKLVRAFPDSWELYDIEADRTEAVDLAKIHPKIVASLSLEWQTWATRVGVIPWDRMLENYRRRGLEPEDAEE